MREALKRIARGAMRRLRPANQSVRSRNERLEEEIRDVYQNLLERQPDVHELLHWQISIGGNKRIDHVVNSLLMGREYQQKSITRQKVLIDIQTEGQSFRIYAMQNDLDVGRNIINSQIYESHVTRVLVDVLKLGDVFLDLGANIGYFSLLAASIVRESGKVISFEPNVQNLQLLYSSIVENRFENIRVYPLAASNSNQILKLTSFGSNGYLEAVPSGKSNFQFVQTVTADELLQCEKQINVVKMDIEGYESLALRGMDKMIRKFKPTIFTEFSPWHIKHRANVNPQDYLEQIMKYGYVLSIIEASGATTPAPDTDFLMDIWKKFDNDKQHLDLIARPV
jgi:FkbM family methyltransferase